MGHYDGPRERDEQRARQEERAHLLRLIARLEKVAVVLQNEFRDASQAAIRLREAIMWLERECPAEEKIGG